MSKSKNNKYNSRYADQDYIDGNVDTRRVVNDRRKDKRVERALKTKNIDILIEIDNEGIDPIDYEEDLEDNLEYMKVEWK